MHVKYVDNKSLKVLVEFIKTWLEWNEEYSTKCWIEWTKIWNVPKIRMHQRLEWNKDETVPKIRVYQILECTKY